MFFRRKKATTVDPKPEPIVGKDGNLYIEEGQDYDEDEYETDSDYSSIGDDGDGDGGDDDKEEEEGLEYEEEPYNENEHKNATKSESGSDHEEEKEEEEKHSTSSTSSAENDEMIPWDASTSEEGNMNGMSTEMEHDISYDTHASDITDDTDDKDDNVVVKTDGALASPDEGEEVKIGLNTPEVEEEIVDNNKVQVKVQMEEEMTPLLHDVEIHQNGNEKAEVVESDVDEDRGGAQEQQPFSTSLTEKRSLLALAAEHDRVDIIKTILQSSHPDPSLSATSTSHNNDVGHLIQLLLNNKIINNNGTSATTETNETGKGPTGPFNQSHLENVFLPPLHIAVASSSTNAASCLLRMGADPSIRPSIPPEWDGPVWNDALNNNNNNNDGGGFTSPKTKRKAADVKNHWRKLDGLSAWEVAFGSTKSKSVNGGDDKENNSNNNNQSKGKSSSWFGSWSSSSSNNNSASDSWKQKGPLFDIAPSKLEGIKHAFTAEALRAIGSDEVHRLRELLGSGMNRPMQMQQNQDDDDYDDDGAEDLHHGVEIGGKDLIGWCVEMNAEGCIEMLRETYSSSLSKDKDDSHNEDKQHQDKKLKAQSTKTKTSDIATEKTAETKEDIKSSSMATSTITDEEVTESNLYSLEIKLEENRVLAGSLSLVLDNLAEEVSLTQGLLQQHGSSENTALISQVRTLKENRGDVESQISEWEGRLADRIVELRMVLGWWKAKGGSEDDFVEIFDNVNVGGNSSLSPSSQLSPSSPLDTNSAEGTQSLRSRVLEKAAQVTLSESKVRKLRASIADLAEENSQNLIKVGKLGLTGAVSLARKLKEEVKEREHILQNLQQREAACRTRVCMIRNQLENLSAEAPIARTPEATSEVVEGRGQTQPIGEDSIEATETANVDESHTETAAGQTETETEVNGEEGSIIEYVDDSDDSDVAYEYYTESEEEEAEYNDNNNDDVVIPQSELIQKGMSTALALREEQHQFLSFKLWELLMRIVGLSKKAIKETAQSNLEDLGNLPRAMIV